LAFNDATLRLDLLRWRAPSSGWN